MCGRTALAVLEDVLIERFEAVPKEPIPQSWNIAPGDDLAVITNDEPDAIEMFRWGLVPHWADNPSIGNRLINARGETLSEKPSFRDAYANRRCLVLVDGFYEWRTLHGEKQPYRICKDDGSPFALAGLWEQGGDVSTMTIVTTEANEVVGEIHDRMPVIVPQQREETWLASGEQGLLEPYRGEDLRLYPISRRVNNPQHDGPGIIKEVDISGGQRGLGEFGG